MKACFIGILVFLLIGKSAPNDAYNEKKRHYSVGLKDFTWVDHNRYDGYYGGKRIVNARVWYPTNRNPDDGESSSYYLKLEEAFSDLEGWSDHDLNQVRSIKTNSFKDAEWSEFSEQYPLIVFSPSLGGNISQYTFYAEYLAENGYIVMGVNHLYESEYVVGDDGKTFVSNLTFHDSLKMLNIPDQISADEYRKVKGKRQKVLGEDLILGINKILEEPFFDKKINSSLIGAMGHSIGGAAAIYASIMDQRIRAVVDLDGTPPTVALIHGIEVPFLFIEDLTDYKNHQGYAKLHVRRNNFCERNKQESWRILIGGINHNSFLDINYYLEEDEKLKRKNEMFLMQVNDYVKGFFDHHFYSVPLPFQKTTSDSLEILRFEK